MHYLRSDFTVELIRRKIIEGSKLDYTFESSEDNLALAVSESNWVDVAALGYLASMRWPDRVRGFLAHADGLKNLGLICDAKNIVTECLRRLPGHPIATVRYLQILEVYSDFNGILKVFQNTPVDNLDDRAISIWGGAILATKRFCDIKSLYGIDRDVIARLFRQIDLQNSELVYESSIAKILSSINRAEIIDYYSELSKDPSTSRDSEVLGWYILNNEVCGERFYSVAGERLSGENDDSPRVLFFRSLAYKKYPSNIAFVKNFVKSLCQKRLVDDAYIILERHADSAMDDADYLKMRLRVESVVKGAVLSPMRDVVFDDSDLGRVTQLEAIRRANVAKWRLDDALHASIRQKLFLNDVKSQSISRALSFSIEPELATRKRDGVSVAVCVSGQLRNFEQNSSSIRANIVDKINADVFVHVWDLQASFPPRFRFLDRVLGRDMFLALPDDFRDHVRFASFFKKTTKKLNTIAYTPVSEELIQSFLPSKKVAVESESVFLRRYKIADPLYFARTINQVKMFYKIYACDNLLRACELDSDDGYDVVVRIRPDLDIQIPNIEKYVEDCRANKNRVYISYINGSGCGDQFAIGSRAAMSVYSSVFSYLMLANSFKYLPGFDGQPAEPLMANHLLACGIEFRLIPTAGAPAKLVSDIALAYHDISLELEEDVLDGGVVDLFMPFLKAYASWCGLHKKSAYMEGSNFWKRVIGS